MLISVAFVQGKFPCKESPYPKSVHDVLLSPWCEEQTVLCIWGKL